MLPINAPERSPTSRQTSNPLERTGTTDTALFDADGDGGAVTLDDVDDALASVTVAGAATELVERLSRHVATADIEAAFYLNTLTRLASGPSLTETTVLLLRDGLAFLDLVTSPLGLTVPDSPAEMAGWTRWRDDGDGGYELEHGESGSWHALEGVEIDRDAGAADILAGHYVRRTAYNLAGTAVTRREGLVLSEDGEFERRGDTFVTRGGTGFGGRPSATYTSWSSVDDLPADADGRPVHDRWRLLEDGLTLEVTRADGRTERRLGYRLGSGFVLDGQAYARGAGSARPSTFGEAAARRTGDEGSWLALLAEAEEEKKRRAGGDATLDPDVIAREAAARERVIPVALEPDPPSASSPPFVDG